MALDPILQRVLTDARSGKLDAAIADVRRIVQLQPGNTDALQVIAFLLMQAGQAEQASHHLARAVRQRPDSAPTRNNYASALAATGKTREAVEQLRKAVEIDPGYAEGWMGLACTLMQVPDAQGAVAAARRGMELRPDWPDMVNNLGLALGLLGKTDELARIAEEGHRAHPDNAKLHSLHLMMLNYSERPGAEVAEAHREFGRRHLAPAGSVAAATAPEPERTLRIGWLSSDLRTHSVAFFAEPLFEHAPAGMETCVFSLQPTPSDPTTQRLRKWAKSWDEVASLDDAALDRRIRSRQIDILIELQGHTPGNRLAMLAGRPAPLIISAIGYPNTTGVPAIDYRLVDSITDPAGSESLAMERLLRIDPCFLCYRSPLDAPEPGMPAANAPTTFGSFNTPSKIGAATISLWRAAMEAVPGSRLLLKATDLNEAAARATVLERLTRGGLHAGRIDIVPGTATIRDHLAMYSRVHVALDTSPYDGTTTTCEALWMGVPVVTIAGDRHASRVGMSLLSAVGHGEWVAATADEYARIAAGLVSDRARLGELRGALRGQVRASVLCDGPGYAARVYAALRECWRKACADGVR